MKKWEEKRSRVVLLLIIIVGSILIVGSLIANRDKNVISNLYEVTPTAVQQQTDGKSIVEINFDKRSETNSLAFFTSHQLVYVYSGDQELYRLDRTGEIWGHTTGNVWNFVAIPDDVTSVEVHLIPCYPEVKNATCVYYLGLGRQIYTCLMRRSMAAFLISMVIIIIGIYLLLYWTIVNRKSEIDETLFYLGVFSVILGIWSVNETDAVTLILENRIGSSFIAFACLMMMGIPFALFVRDFLHMGDKKIWRLFCNTSLIEMFICCILHFTGIFELRRSIIFTHAILAGATLYLIGCMLYKVIKKQVDSRLRISMIGLGFVILATILDLVNYYLKKSNTDVFGRVSFLTFIIILGVESARQTIAILEKGRRAKQLEQFALNDNMTGFYNRNAYDHFVQTENALYNHMIVTFDLNNLKKCNDEHGHAAGDQYIIQTSRIIESNFQKFGQCYRIGGDEFCCIIPNATNCPVERLIHKMNQDIVFLNNHHKLPVEVGIACGYATYSLGDEDIEKVRERADVMMYHNKIKQKEEIR